jgi:hypothetical protein
MEQVSGTKPASNNAAFVELLMKHSREKQSERELGGDVDGERPATTQVIELGSGNTTRQQNKEGGCDQHHEDPSLALAGMNGSQLIDAFREAQGKRAPVYAEFSRGFKEILRSGDLTGYPQLSQGVTKQFSVLSQQINAIEGLLRAERLVREANLIREVQEEEKKKLHLTVAQQLDTIRSQESVDDQEQSLFGHSIKKAVVQLEETVETINSKIRQLGAGAADGDY